jgi:predicted ATPase
MSAFLRSLKLTNFLSFGPQSPDIELTPLNVLIGPNACGKSNFIEALELLHATPTDVSDAIRIGGTAGEWLWKGASGPGTPWTADRPADSAGAWLWGAKPAVIEARICQTERAPELRYRLAFTEANSRLEIVDEALEDFERTKPDDDDVFFYYRFQNGHPVINIKQTVKDEEAGR